jgi:hypothetical protein
VAEEHEDVEFEGGGEHDNEEYDDEEYDIDSSLLLPLPSEWHEESLSALSITISEPALYDGGTSIDDHFE